MAFIPWVSVAKQCDGHPTVIMKGLGETTEIPNGELVTIIGEAGPLDFNVDWRGKHGTAKKVNLLPAVAITANPDPKFQDVVLRHLNDGGHTKIPNGQLVTIFDEAGPLDFNVDWRGKRGTAKKANLLPAVAITANPNPKFQDVVLWHLSDGGHTKIPNGVCLPVKEIQYNDSGVFCIVKHDEKDYSVKIANVRISAASEASGKGKSGGGGKASFSKGNMDGGKSKGGKGYLKGKPIETLDKYTSVDSLHAFLSSGDAVLIKASYVLELAASRQTLPRRQDLPARAIVDPAMLEKLLKELMSVIDVGRSDLANFAGVVITSHAWRSPEHPDKDGRELQRVLAPAVEYYMSERAMHIQRFTTDSGRAKCFQLFAHKSLTMEDIDFGIFFDYCSIYQRPRSKDEEASFRRALAHMDLLYAHQQTVKWRLTQYQPGTVGPPYGERGWPFFETKICQLISWDSHVLDLGRVDFTKPMEFKLTDANGEPTGEVGTTRIFEGRAKPPAELAKQSTYEFWYAQGALLALLDMRRPPMTPFLFSTDIAKMKFTNNADVKDVIALQEQVASAVFSNVKALHFGQKHWAEEDGVSLASALCMCSMLEDLDLINCPIGDAGTAAIAKVAAEGAMPKLSKLQLFNCSIGDRGLQALCLSLAKGVLGGLTLLGLNGNKFTDVTPLIDLLGTQERLPNLCTLRVSAGPKNYSTLQETVSVRKGFEFTV